MAFRSLNFYLENLDDKSIIGSNSNSTSNSISSPVYSDPLRENSVSPEWPLAVDEDVVVVGHTANVRIYDLPALFNGVSVTSTIIPVSANSVTLDSEFLYLGVSSSNTVSKYDKNSIFYSNISSSWANSSSSFGKVVKARDGLLLVSAPNNFNNIGSVHVFDSRGLETAILKPNTANQYTGFGTSIDLRDNTIVIGAPYDLEGKAYVYDYSGKLKNVLVGPNVNSRFGYSVAVGFSSILVGAPNTTSRGGAYVYSTSGSEIKYIDPTSYGIGFDEYIGDYSAIESGKALLFVSPKVSINFANPAIYSIDLRANSHSAYGLPYTVNLGIQGKVGFTTSNANVFVCLGQDYWSGQKNIYTYSIQKRTHLLEEPI